MGGFALSGLLYLLIILTHKIQPYMLVLMGFQLTQFIVFLIVERQALKNKTKTKIEFAVKQYSLKTRRLYFVIMSVIFLSLFSYTIFRSS
jgi:hypothetical protein